jgi:hypothetical protein
MQAAKDAPPPPPPAKPAPGAKPGTPTPATAGAANEPAVPSASAPPPLRAVLGAAIQAALAEGREVPDDVIVQLAVLSMQVRAPWGKDETK